MANLWFWIQTHIDKKDGDTPDYAYKLKAAGHRTRITQPFTQPEMDRLKELDLEPMFDTIKEAEVSHLVLALEVARIWSKDIPKDKRPLTGVSDKKIGVGKYSYAKYMIQMKVQNNELYTEQKQVIEDSSEHAEVWYNYIKQYIIGDTE